MPDFHNDFSSLNLGFDIPIFQKAYDLYKLYYQYLVNFPKKDRFTLGLRCENVILDLLEAITEASQVSRNGKLPILQNASLKLDQVKMFIRLAKDLKILDNKKYLILESHLQEIGRMLGGWIKSSTQ